MYCKVCDPFKTGLERCDIEAVKNKLYFSRGKNKNKKEPIVLYVIVALWYQNVLETTAMRAKTKATTKITNHI